jgi:predicted DNA-binding protein (UPF0251 family)
MRIYMLIVSNLSVNRCGRGRGRPRMGRRIGLELGSDYFKPAGIPLRELSEVGLTVEELEAIRLVDLKDLDQEDAAKEMGVSRKTLWRELQSAREKIADALVNGKAIQISGGEKMPRKDGTGPEGKGPRTGRGLGNCSKSKK